MGLFSLFKKAEALPPLTDDEQARLAANSEAERKPGRAPARDRPRHRHEDRRHRVGDGRRHFQPAGTGLGSQRPPRPPRDSGDDELGDIPTTLLLADDALPLAAADDSAPAVEEIAILYANGQSAVAQQMLTAAVADTAGQNSDRTAWWMLFDLYQASGQQDAFDNLSIDYASTFETSPPSWQAPLAAAPGWAGLTPTESFSGVLGPHIARSWSACARWRPTTRCCGWNSAG
jgi:hypothetical protein